MNFDEINRLADASIATAESTEDLIDSIETILVLAYQRGFDAVEEMLEVDMAFGTDQMQSAIYAKLDGMTFTDRAITHIENDDRTALIALVENESHRVASVAGFDCAFGAFESGIDVEKCWVTTGDNRVRDTHKYLGGTWVPADDYFWTFDGDCAKFPGGFASPENNVGCRCWNIYRRGHGH